MIAAALALVFLALNYQAFDSYFQDDEFDNMAWTSVNAPAEYGAGLLSPRYSTANFRPVGHLYFRVMTRLAGLNFASWVPSLFLIHLLNGVLLFLLLRRLGTGEWGVWLGTAFFVLSGAAMDAYWKPMYVFDLLCTTLCLASVLFYSQRRWILSFVAFWLAYKSKELAVMLPAVLVAYEYWLGERKFLRLVPFLVVSLSFGTQGLLLNPNKDNDYTFRFSLAALKVTLPWYANRFMGFRGSGLLLLPLLLVRDRRVWFGLAAMTIIVSLLSFLPGRTFEAYAYLPLAFASIALAAGASRSPRVACAVFLLWFGHNMNVVRGEQREALATANQIAAFAQPVMRMARLHPQIHTLIFDGLPATFHHWGATGAWNIGHGTLGYRALYIATPEAIEAMAKETIALAKWDAQRPQTLLLIREPDQH